MVLESKQRKSHTNYLQSSTTLEIADVDPKLFALMLQCMYTSQISMTALGKDKVMTDNLTALMIIAVKYRVDVLRMVCVNYLRHRLTPKSALSLFQNPASAQLALPVVENNIITLIHSPEFLDLPVESLKLLLDSDTLMISELELFHALGKWSSKECVRKNQKESVDAKRAALKELLPLIRFPTMAMNDLATEVRTSSLLADTDLVLLFTWAGKIQALKAQSEIAAAQAEFMVTHPEFPYSFRPRKK